MSFLVFFLSLLSLLSLPLLFSLFHSPLLLGEEGGGSEAAAAPLLAAQMRWLAGEQGQERGGGEAPQRR